MHGRRGASILITGVSGSVGGLVATAALARSDADLVLPLRDLEARPRVLEALAAELAAAGRPLSSRDHERLTFLPLPAPGQISSLAPRLRDLGVTEILHCAGCSNYLDLENLERANVGLTREMVELGRALHVDRFLFVSTAYACGPREGVIPEDLHAGVSSSATAYMRSKHEAEGLVAASGLPWLIVRPSVVIGDSRDGRYAGKRFGVYQFWSAGERFHRRSFPPVVHAVAADVPVNFVHQDAFTAACWRVYEASEPGSCVHIVSRDDTSPTLRQLSQLWFTSYGGPREVHFHDTLDAVPMEELDARSRRRLAFTASNSEIASVRWQFGTERLDGMRQGGLEFADATLESMERCQHRFVRDQPDIRDFVEAYRERGVARPRFLES